MPPEKSKKPSDSPPRFAGFRPKAFAFFKELAAEMNRDWFLEHKSVYEAEVLEPLTALVAELTAALHHRAIPLGVDPKKANFRIYRDVRFSKDKRPYKTHAGAALTRDGEKMSPGLLYLHLDPEGSFAAAGFYCPEPSALKAMREFIAADPDGFHRMTAELSDNGLTLSPDEDALKKLPKGFESVDDPELQSALKRKSFIVRRPLTQKAMGKPTLVKDLVDFADEAMPLLNYGWKAL